MGAVARIVTTCQNGRGHATVEKNREYMLGLFDRALLQKPDLVCFPEAFTGVSVSAPASEVAEPVPGPTTDAFAKHAKENRCYVICPIRTKRDGKEWNSAVVIDRAGDILGVYDKAQPVTTSHDYTVFENGVTPGGKPPVFDLDFGRIGIQICFDAGFPESWAGLAAKGAKAVFWPSAYNGGFTLQTYARLHHVYVITSVRSQRSRIIDPCGRVVAETDQLLNFTVRDVNLDFVVAHNDFNWPILDRIIDTYGHRVRVTSYRDDGHFIVEPMDPAITSTQLQKEFGFESAFQYHDRHRQAYAAIRKGEAPPAQKAAHGDRAQYSK
ncbi:MAG: carbon-nitrogen hydrolase family protein [Planctomycetes bacterium]|nr:carbon-nitrogen hydrolase family protein [Planctomycetota bacterium]